MRVFKVLDDPGPIMKAFKVLSYNYTMRLIGYDSIQTR